MRHACNQIQTLRRAHGVVDADAGAGNEQRQQTAIDETILHRALTTRAGDNRNRNQTPNLVIEIKVANKAERAHLQLPRGTANGAHDRLHDAAIDQRRLQHRVRRSRTTTTTRT